MKIKTVPNQLRAITSERIQKCWRFLLCAFLSCQASNCSKFNPQKNGIETAETESADKSTNPSSRTSERDDKLSDAIKDAESQKKRADSSESTKHIGLHFRKLSNPIIADEFELSQSPDSVFHAISSLDESITFFSLERSKNMSKYFWVVNARKFKLSENGFSEWPGLSFPANIFPECNDPLNGGGVDSFTLVGVRDKYKTPSFSVDSMSSEITHVKIRAKCRIPKTIGLTEKEKIVSLSSLKEDSSVAVSPIADQIGAVCVLPKLSRIVSSSGQIFDYLYKSVEQIPGNFYDASQSNYLGEIFECIENAGLLQLKTRNGSKDFPVCLGYSINTRTLYKGVCKDFRSIRSIQPFLSNHFPYEKKGIANSLFFNIETEIDSFKIYGDNSGKLVFSTNGITSNKPDEVGLENVVNIDNPLFNFLSSQNLAQTYVGREVRFGRRILAWNQNKTQLFLSDSVISNSAIDNSRLSSLNIISPKADSFVGARFSILGGCIPASIVEIRLNPISDSVYEAKCASNGTFEKMVSNDNYNGLLKVDVFASELRGGREAQDTTSITADTVSPSVSIVAPSISTIYPGSETYYQISFSDNFGVSEVDPSMLSLLATGDANCKTYVREINFSTLRFEISECRGKGAVSLVVGSGAAADLVGNNSALLISKEYLKVEPTTDIRSTTWVNGSENRNQFGAYGLRGIISPFNSPGARRNSVSWVDSVGNAWLFGGFGCSAESYCFGMMNDLWKFDGKHWTWVSGSTTYGQPGNYGSKGFSSGSNTPGARIGAVSWVDSNENLWLFGGWGMASDGYGLLNDLWKWDGKNWIWVSGSDLANQRGQYGQKGSPTNSNVPGSRGGAVSWTDSTGNFWLFGGTGFGDSGNPSPVFLNDLWKWDGSNWTWVSGGKNEEFGTYGVKGISDFPNVPGARSHAIGWADLKGNIWLFGGQGYGARDSGALNDLWKWDGKYWTWQSGSYLANQTGEFGKRGIPSPFNSPSARSGAVSFRDSDGNFWLFGGGGVSGEGPTGHLNDVWKFDGTRWTWVSGSQIANQQGHYALMGDPNPQNVIGARSGSVSWTDLQKNFWIFGGENSLGSLNDLWRFTPSH